MKCLAITWEDGELKMDKVLKAKLWSEFIRQGKTEEPRKIQNPTPRLRFVQHELHMALTRCEHVPPPVEGELIELLGHGADHVIVHTVRV